jgi:hypothetical protein
MRSRLVYLCMADIEPSQAWEMYSADAKSWTRVIVTKVEDGEVTLRHEGVLEFVRVDLADMKTKPELFRPAPP